MVRAQLSDQKNISGGVFAPTEEAFKLTVKPQGVRFLNRAVQPPSQVYVEAEDDLAVSVASSVTGEAVTFNYRLLRFDGEIIEGQFVVRPANNRSVTKYSESLAEGFLLSMSCQATAATTRGQTFVRVSLTSPAFQNSLPSYMLMADYVTVQMAPAHPNGRVLAPSEGPGWVRGFAVANPAPGFAISQAVPANARWLLKAFNATMVTDATAGNRTEELIVTVGGRVAFQASAIVVQAPSKNVLYSGAPLSLVAPLDTALNYFPLAPSLTLLGGDLVGTTALGGGPADQWSAITLAVEEWLDNV